MEEQTGIDRFGSNSLIKGSGAMLIIGVAVGLVFLLLLLLYVLSQHIKCFEKVFNAVKRKVVFNAALRYVLQSSLKLQVAASTVLVYDKWT